MTSYKNSSFNHKNQNLKKIIHNLYLNLENAMLNNVRKNNLLQSNLK